MHIVKNLLLVLSSKILLQPTLKKLDKIAKVESDLALDARLNRACKIKGVS